MKHDAEKLKQFFFQAALATYVSGKKAERPLDRPWVKRFAHHGDGEFAGLVYMDEYMTSGEWSGGSTVIVSAEDPTHPIWLMQYHGWCLNDDPAVLAFLKAVLAETYGSGEFAGGRGKYGLWSSNDGTLGYENTTGLLPSLSEFTNFMGHERIYRNPGPGKYIREGVVFWHRYQGLLLSTPDTGDFTSPAEAWPDFL